MVVGAHFIRRPLVSFARNGSVNPSNGPVTFCLSVLKDLNADQVDSLASRDDDGPREMHHEDS